tara:strand:+ start:270 stop:1100 length:831 start_codon:yes stop_codon:yes gene_type:complete
LSTTLREINPSAPFLSGPLTVIRNMYRRRRIVFNFIKRDIRLKYRNSSLGYFWSLLEPLLLSAVYFILFTIITDRPREDYALLVILGVISWTLFSRGLKSSISSLTHNEMMIKQVYLPREIFAVTSVGSNLVINSFSLFVAIPFIIYFDITLNQNLVLVPIGLLILSIMALGVGLMMAWINAINRDVEHFFAFVTRAGFFLSPVMWTIEMVPESGLQYALLNPVVVPITMIRNGLTGEDFSIELTWVAYSISFSILSFIIGSTFFKKMEPEVIKKI